MPRGPSGPRWARSLAVPDDSRFDKDSTRRVKLGIQRRDVVVPRWLEAIGAWGWRFVGSAAALYVLGKVLTAFDVVVIPVLIALLVSTALSPPARWLRQHGFAPALATLTVFVAGLVVVAAVGWWVVPGFIEEGSSVGPAIGDGVNQVEQWLIDGPIGLSEDQLAGYQDKIGSQLTDGEGGVVSGVIESARTAANVTVGLVLTLVLTFFLVKDGTRIVEWVLNRFDPEGTHDLATLGDDLWFTIGGYVRGTAVNGLVNAVILAIGLLLLGVPLVLPLAVLSFLGGFVPLVGAFIAGGAAAFVALADNGLGSAIAVVALTIGAHNVEGYLVGPLVMGRAVRLPPAAVLVSLTAGGAIAGVWGLLLAVPACASGVTVYRWTTANDSEEPAEVSR